MSKSSRSHDEVSHQSSSSKRSSERSRHHASDLHRRSRRRSRSRSPPRSGGHRNRNAPSSSREQNDGKRDKNAGGGGVPKRQRSRRKMWTGLKKKLKMRKAYKRNFEQSENHAMGRVTQEHLQEILQNDDYLCDIPFDITLPELEGEIALAKGHATTIYVRRDGLSKLTVVLPQVEPTIANLKRGIERAARIQLQRKQRQRYEDRLRRRNEQLASNNNNNRSNNSPEANEAENEDEDEDGDRQQVSAAGTTIVPTTTTQGQARSSGGKHKKLQFRNTGELVYSEALSGQHHRENVSWRFLWRAYALLNVETKIPLDDTNGRALLSDLGVENAATLKFCNRDKYFGKLRQR